MSDPSTRVAFGRKTRKNTIGLGFLPEFHLEMFGPAVLCCDEKPSSFQMDTPDTFYISLWQVVPFILVHIVSE